MPRLIYLALDNNSQVTVTFSAFWLNRNDFFKSLRLLQLDLIPISSSKNIPNNKCLRILFSWIELVQQLLQIVPHYRDLQGD